MDHGPPWLVPMNHAPLSQQYIVPLILTTGCDELDAYVIGVPSIGRKLALPRNFTLHGALRSTVSVRTRLLLTAAVLASVVPGILARAPAMRPVAGRLANAAGTCDAAANVHGPLRLEAENQRPAPKIHHCPAVRSTVSAVLVTVSTSAHAAAISGLPEMEMSTVGTEATITWGEGPPRRVTGFAAVALFTDSGRFGA